MSKSINKSQYKIDGILDILDSSRISRDDLKDILKRRMLPRSLKDQDFKQKL
jgi:hypothetical protein